jgi:hypothetical protein
LGIDEDVECFDVAVDDATAVEILEGREKLVCHRPHLLLGVDVAADLPAFEDLVEVALGGVLHDDVEVFLVGEELVQLDDVRVVQFRQQLDLRTGLPRVLALSGWWCTFIEDTWIFFIASTSFVRICCTR